MYINGTKRETEARRGRELGREMGECVIKCSLLCYHIGTQKDVWCTGSQHGGQPSLHPYKRLTHVCYSSIAR